MALLWVQEESVQWKMVPLKGHAYIIEPEAVPAKALRRDDDLSTLRGDNPVIMRRSFDDEPDIWLLLHAGPKVRINGLPAADGYRVLEEGDEITIGSRLRLQFSLIEDGDHDPVDAQQLRVAC